MSYEDAISEAVKLANQIGRRGRIAEVVIIPLATAAFGYMLGVLERLPTIDD